MTTIRREKPGDAEGIRDINLLAFDGDAEADLVDRLRVACAEAIALVAQDQGELVGHILFTPVSPLDYDQRSDSIWLTNLLSARDADTG